jgi:hypothetical protein
MSARQALQQKRQASCIPISSGIEIFELRLRSFLVEEKGQVLIRSVTLEALCIARTLRFAAAIGVRAGEMKPEELNGKRLALDRCWDVWEPIPTNSRFCCGNTPSILSATSNAI